MRRSISFHIARLTAYLGAPEIVAALIRGCPRAYRRICRERMSKQAGCTLRHASHALYLRLLLKELRRSGAVTDQAVSAAARSVNAMLDAEKSS